jgi:hypothetical protein
MQPLLPTMVSLFYLLIRGLALPLFWELDIQSPLTGNNAKEAVRVHLPGRKQITFRDRLGMPTIRLWMEPPGV